MENSLCKNNNPITLVIFGITGDLIKTYVLSSLYELFLDNKFCKECRIICFIRRKWSNADLRKYLRNIMVKGNYPNEEMYTNFLELFSVSIGSFDEKEGYKELNKELLNLEKENGNISEKIYYLAISPEHFKDAIKNIGESGKEMFNKESFKKVKVVIEKPFGFDLKDANELDDLISNYFEDNQIFRVDHYLAKYSLRYLEEISFIETFGEKYSLENATKIQIKMLEKLGVEDRVSFYDKIGALRDTGQNHLLQMFATLLTTQAPKDGLNYSQNRLDAIQSLNIIDKDKVGEKVKRIQLVEYLNIPGINKNSNTETYFNINTSSKYFHNKELEVILEGGKYQKETIFSIEITYPEYILIMKLKPIKTIQLWTHGDSCNLIKEVKIPFEGKPSEYYNIFLEVSEGNGKYFVSKEEVIGEWKFVDPILKYWKEHSIHRRSNKTSLSWKLLILGYILILVLCAVVILQMTK